MTLSHAIEITPSIIDNVLTNLNSGIKTKIKQAQAGTEFEQVEKAMHTAFVEVKRLVLAEILAQYDITPPLFYHA